MAQSNLKFHISAMLMVAVWGVSFLNTRTLLHAGLNPSEIYMMRFALAYAGLLLFSRGHVRWLGWRTEGLLLLSGITGGSIYFIAENTALRLTLVSDVAILVALAPMLTSLQGCVIYRDERFTPLMACGSLLALAGVVVLTLKDGVAWGDSIAGDALGFMAALSWAVYSLIIKKLNRTHPTLEVTRKTFFYGLVTSVPLLAVQQSGLSCEVLAQPAVWGNIVYLGLVCSMAAFFMWGRAVKAIGAIRASNYLYCGPIVSMLAAAVWIPERIPPAGYAGCILILLGLALVNRRHRSE